MLDKLLSKEEVLKYVKLKGPLIPIHLVSLLKSNTIMIGAALSELAHDSNVKISNMKVGGSPLYYIEEQKAKLQDFYKYLNEKDRRTFDALKLQKVLRDSEVTPLLRVSLRNIKDFAVAVEIEHNGSKELFWRWYLTEKQEAISIIRGLLGLQVIKKKAEEKQIIKNETFAEPIIQEKVKEKIEIKIEEKINDKVNDKIEQKLEQKKIDKFVEKKQIQQEQFIQPSKEQTILLTAQSLLETSSDLLLQKCKLFFIEKNIHVKELTIIKKEKEIAGIIIVPSAIGEIYYYCSMKQKKKVNENELAAIYLDAQNKKLPAFVLIQGEFSKKAYEKVNEQFINMKLIQL